jgi:hypothetical protein
MLEVIEGGIRAPRLTRGASVTEPGFATALAYEDRLLENWSKRPSRKTCRPARFKTGRCPRYIDH